MARTDNLKVFLTDVADAIRTKKGTTELIPANTFDTEIESISGYPAMYSPRYISFYRYKGRAYGVLQAEPDARVSVKWLQKKN